MMAEAVKAEVGNEHKRLGTSEASRNGMRLITVCILCTIVLAQCVGTCRVHPGYLFMAGKDIPAEQPLGVPALSDGSTLAYAVACSKNPNCTAFTTQGELMLGVLQGPWDVLPTTAGACDGVYVRAQLAPVGGYNNMTGMAVSADFDLPLSYYTRISWDDCQRLCTATAGCRSVDYFFPEQTCRLKSATCFEAQPGKGCLLSGHDTIAETFVHADRYTNFDFLASQWRWAITYLALTSSRMIFSDAATACQQAGLQLASMHASDNLKALYRAAARHVMAGNQSAESGLGSTMGGPFLFWLGGMQNSSSAGGVTWLDGTRFTLDSPSVTVAVSGGCLALSIPDISYAQAVLNNEGSSAGSSSPGGPLLVALSCDQLGVPVCAVYPDGVPVYRFQTDSTVVDVYYSQVPHEDAAVVCSLKGSELFTPYGVRGRELLSGMALFDSVTDTWLNGYCNSGTCAWASGDAIPTDYPVSPVLAGTSCIRATDYEATALVATTCSEIKGFACLTAPPSRPINGTPDVPARVRMHAGSAYLFFTAGRTYTQAEQQCRALGAHMASIHDSAEDELISGTWYDLDPPSNNFNPVRHVRRYLTYLGGDTNKTYKPAWLDGTEYQYEGSRLGTAFDGRTGCLTISSLGVAGPAKWELIDMQDCKESPFNYTCKLPAKNYLQFSAAVVSEGALYELHDRTPRTYPDAREACLARGGDMASLDMGSNEEDVKLFLRRFHNEQIGWLPTMGDCFVYFVGAVTNKTDTKLYASDFYWQDGSPYSWAGWAAAYPPGSPVNYTYTAGTKTVGALASIQGLFQMVRKRYNHSLPFLCKVNISQPLSVALATDGATYEILTTPYTLPYHAAEQVCQSRGGHLAGVSSSQQLALVAKLCQGALQALPRAGNNSFASHDVEDGCWVGLYCSGGFNADISFKDGFGERGLQLVAASEPAVLRASGACNSPGELLWLDGRSTGDGALTAAAAASLAPASRCGMVLPAAGNGSGSLAMASCKQFAAFVCERNAPVTESQTQPSLTVGAGATTWEDIYSTATLTASDSLQFHGCFDMVTTVQTAVSSGLATAATPLPVLLSSYAPSLSLCHDLTVAAGLSYFGIVGGTACWAGPDPPGLPFYNVSDPSPCYQPCSLDASTLGGSTAGQRPGCGVGGYTSVFHVNDTSSYQSAAAATTITAEAAAGGSNGAPVAYVCMREQALAAPNASVVGQLHISLTQLSACEALCSSLPACDLYTYDTQAHACVLLSVPAAATGGLASLPVLDALWAAATCVKASRLAPNASLTQLPGADGDVVVHACSSSLAAMIGTAGGPALSPMNDQPVADLAACAQSCAANTTCQGFAVLPQAAGSTTSNNNSGSLLCRTRTGLVVDRGNDWVPSRPWVELSDPAVDALATNEGASGCLVASRLERPPAYVCSELVDVAGWELQRLNTSDAQACRSACDAHRYCSVYVVYSSPPSCSLRFRIFYNGTVTNVTAGTNLRPNASVPGPVRSCFHTFRFVLSHASPAVNRRTRQAKMGKDNAWHTCVPHMDILGLDVKSVDRYDDVSCAQVCSTISSCNCFVTSTDAFPTGVCYTKKEPILFTFYERLEYLDLTGHSRVDMVSVTDACFNVERQLPRSPPSYSCAYNYSLALTELSRLAAATAFACEAACDAAAACVSYTWMDHNGTCVLGTISGGGSKSNTQVFPASGPAWFATQTCLHVPRFMAGGSNQQHVQVGGAWHYCAQGLGPSVAWADSNDGATLLAAFRLQAVGIWSSGFDPVQACARECAAVDGCQTFTLVWQNTSDASPACLLRGWASSAPLTSPPAASDLRQTCVSLAPERTFRTVAGGVVHPNVQPVAVQSYHEKQYSLYLTPATYSVAAGICQGGSGDRGTRGQLVAINNWQELAVVGALLKPYLQACSATPSASPVLNAAAFWTGLQWVGNSTARDSNCTGWCYGQGQATNTSYVTSLLLSARNSTTTACAALLATENSSQPSGLLPVSCWDRFLPFICEHQLHTAPADTTNSGTDAPVRVLPAQLGYSDAKAHATAAGAVLAVLDLSASTATRVSAASRRALRSTNGTARFTALASAAAACGSAQLVASGCWLELHAPADACADGSTYSALCDAAAVLLTSPSSRTATKLQALTAVLGPAPVGDQRCVLALVNGSSVDAAYLAAPCSTPAASLVGVVDPEAPLSVAVLPDTMNDSSGGNSGLSKEQLAGTVVGSVVGGVALLLAVTGLALYYRSRRLQGSTPRDASAKDTSAGGFSSTLNLRLAAASGSGKGESGCFSLVASRGDKQDPGSLASAANGQAAKTSSYSDMGLLPTDRFTGNSQPSTSTSAVALMCGVPQPSGTRGQDAGSPSAPAAAISPATFNLSQGSSLGLSTRLGASAVSTACRLREAPPQCGSPAVSQQGSQQLVVTAEDPDQLDVTWQIDPKRDVTWDETDVLGKGTFGIVYRGTYRGQPVAIKTVLRGGQGKYEMAGLRSLLQEARILAKVRHPNIVTCYGGCITDTNVFIVEELMSQTLGQLISSAGPSLLPLDLVLRIGIDVANGLFQLHPTIVHRDLKPDNVLLDAAGAAKISDFGLARFKLSSYLSSTKSLAAGTIPYMAPETLREELKMISEKADVYSLAVILWAMLSGSQQPWQDYHYAAVLYKVSIRGERPPLPEDPARCPPRLAALIQRMWSQEPAARPGAGEVMKHLSVVLRDVQRGTQPSSAVYRRSSAPYSSDTADEERGRPFSVSREEAPRSQGSEGRQSQAHVMGDCNA